jgi:RHS repeat-associated protein
MRNLKIPQLFDLIPFRLQKWIGIILLILYSCTTAHSQISRPDVKRLTKPLLSNAKDNINAVKDTVITPAKNVLQQGPVKPGTDAILKADTLIPKKNVEADPVTEPEDDEPTIWLPQKQNCKAIVRLPVYAYVYVPVTREPVKKAPPVEPAKPQRIPFLQVHGNVMYNVNYYSNIDTPYNEQDIYQHTVQTYLDVTVKGKYPMRVYLTNRFTNSKLFRNFSDLNFNYNNTQFTQKIKTQVREKFMASLPTPKAPDSLKAELDATIKKLRALDGWIKNPGLIQKLVEAREKAMRDSLRNLAKIPDTSLKMPAIDSALTRLGIDTSNIEALYVKRKQQADRASVGTPEQFKTNFITQARIPADEVESYSSQINAAYRNAMEACNELCGDSASADNDIRNAMLQDMTPPYGQYVSYPDATGQPDKVYNANSDMMVAPNTLSRTEFTQNFRTTWAEALLPYHPEYCKLKELEALRPSNLWDRKMEAVDNYKEAKAAGYLNPTNITNDLYNYGANAGNIDPLLSLHQELKSKLEDRMINYVKLNNGKTVNIWAMANIVTKCDEGNTGCTDHYNNNKSNNFDTTWCDGDLDLAWISFRNLYLQVKQVFVNELVNKPANCTPASPVYTVMPKREDLVNAGFQPQFYETLKTVLTEQKLDYANDPDKVSQAKAEAQSQLNAQYDKNVDVLAAQWYDQLAPCYVNNGNDLRDIIIPLLKQLCRKACDQDHLFGASSLPAGAVLEGTGYHNFMEIIEGYNSTHGIASDSLACSADNITVPAPYDKQPIYFNKPVYDKPAACECEILNEQYIQYSNTRNQGGEDADFAAYLKRTQGVTMSNSNLQILLSLCNNTVVPGEAGNACTYLKDPILLPPALQCNSKEVCTSCTVVNSLYQSFKQQYPNDTPRLADTDDTIQVKRNVIFQNYMNNHLGYAKQTWEYLQFIKECSDSAASINTIHYCTDERIGNLYFTEGSALGKLQDIQPTPDGGYILAGSVAGVSKEGILVKTDSLGRKQWAKYYGGMGSDTLLRVRRTSDNGYIAVGTTHSGHHSSGAMWIMKVTSDGNHVWTKTIGFSTPFGEHGYDVIQTRDGGYAALGIYNQHAGHGEFLLARLQSNGNISWIRRFGTSRLQNNSTVCIPGITDSINYNGVPSYGLLEQEDTLLVSGAAYDPNLGDRYFGVIHKVNKNTGNLIRSWHYADGADTTRSCWFRDIYATENGYMVMVNSAQQLGTVNAQVGVINLTKTGDIVSYKRFNIPAGSNRMVTSSVFPVNSGGYMVAQTGNNSTHIIWQRVDASGNLIWTNQTNLAGTQTVGRISQNSNGRFTMAGDNNQQMLVLAMNPGTSCYDQEINLGATDEAISRIPWAIGVDESVSPMYTDTTLEGMAIDLRDSALVCSGGGHCYDEYDGPRLCGRSEPVLPPLVIKYEGGCADSTSFAVSKGTELYRAYTDSLTAAFERNYTEKCLAAYRYESFTVKYTKREYHYTLYYYDQAGNLIRTVPPAGVHIADTMQVRLARKAGIELVPNHTLYTDYRYNTLNQVVAQHSPDGGASLFWYDRLGRLSVSQNAKQKVGSQYSYTKYDIIGRITEVGQLTSSTVMADATSRDKGSLATWLQNAAPTAEQITKTSYDVEYTPILEALKATNLRNRVAWTALYDNAADLDTLGFANASYYSYDILGNVDTLLHYYKKGIMKDKDNGLKKIAYDFDLVSGKVNQVSYQPGQKDAFYHKYLYDAENRITNVLTSADSINWDNDAYYQYYDHGPLARAVIGEQQVQGINYAYNLQGWMKWINPAITTGYTLKPDGSTGSVVGKPAFQVGLNYFDGDYKAISGATPWSGAALTGDYRSLYNGNISSMAVNIGALNNPLLYNYQYDQLNRLVAMDAWKRNSNDWADITKIIGGDFQERVKYDANGNILSYIRNGNTAGGKQLAMDKLAYHYKTGTNQLDYVYDTVPAGNYDVDIDEQTAGNYEYDSIGNLIKDKAEGIASISWTVYGKISRIVKNDSTRIIYAYDASGNRISKLVIPSSGGQGVTTWYIRDAQGNVMSVYEADKSSVNDGHLTQTELHLYGSSRLGLLRRSLDVDSIPAGPDPYKITMPIFGEGDSIPFARGNKLFELSNHLGNVLVAINDKKIGVSSPSNSSLIDHFEPQVVSAQDYYPFGMLQPGRSFLSPNGDKYRYGFNGKENDNDVKGEGNQQDYGFRIYDPRIGKFLSVDPLTKDYPELTPYQFASNSPIICIDIDGLEGADSKERTQQEAKGLPLFTPINYKAVEGAAKEVAKEAAKSGVREGAKRVITSTAMKAGGLTLVLTALPLRGGPDFPHHDEMYYYHSKERFKQLYPNDPPRQYDKPEPETFTLYKPKDTYRKPLVITKENVDDGPEHVYRGGAYTDINFTPRPGQDDGTGPKSGLSTFITPIQATRGNGGKVQTLDVKTLAYSGFIITIVPDGHAGIRPPTQEELEKWAATRPKLETGGDVHERTQAAKAARKGEFKVPRP